MKGELALLVAIVCAGCAGPGSVPDAGQPVADVATDVTALADEYVRGYFETFPDEATAAGYPGADHAAMSDNTLEGMAAWDAREDAWLARVEAVDAAAITGTPAAMTHRYLRELLRAEVAFRACRTELWNVSPTYQGWQSVTSFLASIQPVDTPSAREAALGRWRQFPAYLDVETDNLREGLRLGYRASRHNVMIVLGQLDALLEAPVDESPYLVMAGDGTGDEFQSAVRALVADEIRPAIGRHRDFLRDEYLAAARDPVGVDANPNGEECYAAATAYHATVDLSAAEIHEIGQRELERVLGEVGAIGERLFGSSDPRAVFDAALDNPEYRFGGRADLIGFAEAAVERARTAAPDWFGRVPSARVAVEPFPAFIERGAPGGVYNAPAEDGSRPGTFLIRAYEAERQSRAEGLESTAFHETYPGHHLQIALAMERTDLHPLTRYFSVSGYTEGWALYSERLADEMGLFTDDIDRIGRLSSEAFRACRLVVDTGMHALGWTRDDAVTFMVSNTAQSRDSLEAELDRYIAVPGQATSYMLGSLEIGRLRGLAEMAQGERFDIRDFHDRVLEDGAMPLPMLRVKIEAWIEESAQ